MVQDFVTFTIGAAITANLIAIFVYPENKRLSESEVAVMLLFDISQLSFLLYLTGGLHNPFSLLVLGPVTVSARQTPPGARPSRSELAGAQAAASGGCSFPSSSG